MLLSPKKEPIPDMPPIMELSPLRLALDVDGGVTIAVAAYTGLITHITSTKATIVGKRTMARHNLKCLKLLFSRRRQTSTIPTDSCCIGYL